MTKRTGRIDPLALTLDRGVVEADQRSNRISDLRALLADAGLGSDDGPGAEIGWVTDEADDVDSASVFVVHPTTPDDEVVQALDGGPALVVAQSGEERCPTSALRVVDTRAALDCLAVAHFDSPASHLRLVGITGTNGKGTTATLVGAALTAAEERRAGLIGSFDGPLTTPRAGRLQSLLRAFVDREATDVIVEVSSHALTEGRTGSCPFEVGAITSVAEDHLGFHGSVEAYVQAKWSFVVDERIPRMIVPRDLAVRFGVGTDERVRVIDDAALWPIPYAGEHNAGNGRLAAAIAGELGLDQATILDGFSSLDAAPGRFEQVDAGGIPCVVDFAHNAAALVATVAAAREIRSRVVLVVGSDAESETDRRPSLARAAVQAADLVIFTEEQPPTGRSTGAQEMAAEVAGLGSFIVCPDRPDAVALALGEASADTIVVLAGRGERAGPANEVGASYPADRDLLGVVGATEAGGSA